MWLLDSKDLKACKFIKVFILEILLQKNAFCNTHEEEKVKITVQIKKTVFFSV